MTKCLNRVVSKLLWESVLACLCDLFWLTLYSTGIFRLFFSIVFLTFGNRKLKITIFDLAFLCNNYFLFKRFLYPLHPLIFAICILFLTPESDINHLIEWEVNYWNSMNSHINKIQYLLSGDIFIEIFSCYLQSVRQEKCEFLAIKNDLKSKCISFLI